MRLFATNASDQSTCTDFKVSEESTSLIDRIRDAYNDQETDGVLSLAQADPSILLQTSPDQLIALSIESMYDHSRKRAAAAGIINAWLGACAALFPNREKAAEIAGGLWEAIETAQNEGQTSSETNNVMISPDVVTYCLAYHVIHLENPTLADRILERALQASKKEAGSKRRKALAAARRRGNHLSFDGTNSDEQTKQLEASLQKVLEDDNLRILVDTNDYIILNKPAGVTCYHSTTTTAGKISKKRNKKGSENEKRISDISLEDALLHCNVPLSTVNPIAQGLVHRLDRGTSGCMIWSKTNEMHAHLVSAFFLRQVKKQYTALVTPAPTHLQADRTTAISIDYPVQGHAAQSTVSCLERYERKMQDGTTKAAALLQVEPSTGRRHQVRIHCADGLNAPVLLDPLYTKEHHQKITDETATLPFLPLDLLPPEDFPSAETAPVISKKSKKGKDKKGQSPPQLQRFCLHASSLSIPSLDIQVQSDLPDWWSGPLERLKKS